ncbi:hypothetical protein KVT40_003453 [Elsinoe batatas]|uniref:Protein RTA1 n=1 Tax=Elsinoe batatas TaxID=2601811 RepID=A0A8K0LCA5_9PEZI|nr:hypothetical protein KVT40_003453 [Elsinoe batatas]
MAVLRPLESGYYVWKYLPSIPAAAVFAALFAIGLVLLSIRMFRTKTWFVVPLLVGVVFECVGYIFRIVCQPRTNALIPFIIQSLLLLVAPALYAASIYMVLGRLIRHINGQSYSVVPVRWMTKIFVIGDVVSFMVQGGGGGLMASNNRSTANMGNNLIIAGLVIQIVLFSFFATTAVIFHLRIRKAPVKEQYDTGVNWQRLMWMLYAASILILVRSIFRLIEYVQGQEGYLLKSEWTLYVFDATLMFLATMVFWRCYPAGIERPAVASSVNSQDHGVPMVESPGYQGSHDTWGKGRQ